MDMNPASCFSTQLTRNSFAFAGFQSTEPWVHEYMALDLPALLVECGFEDVSSQENSPRHRTVAAHKRYLS
jgi:hypothetical protein